MRIVHLLPALDHGGVESVVCDLNRALAGAGHESIVVSRGGGLVDRIVKDGGRHFALDLKSKNPLAYFLRAAALRKLLKSLVAPEMVVCVHSRVPAWLFAWANRELSLPWISYAHGANSVSRYSEIMTRGDRVIAPSRFLGGYLESNYGTRPGGATLKERLRIIPNCVDIEMFDPSRLDGAFVEAMRREWGLESRDFVTMSIGRITPLKGFDNVIRDFAEKGTATQDGRRRRLVIVGGADKGKDGCLRELEALVAKLCPPGSVVFAGRQEKIAECISIADEVVSGNMTKPESFGLAVAEALAMEKPVRLLRRFGGAAEILDDVAAAGKPTTRDAVRALYGFDVMRDRTLAVYREVAK